MNFLGEKKIHDFLKIFLIPTKVIINDRFVKTTTLFPVSKRVDNARFYTPTNHIKKFFSGRVYRIHHKLTFVLDYFHFQICTQI